MLTKLQENSWRLSKEKNGKFKKSSTALKIYYFSSTFQRISLGLKQFVLLFIWTGFINTILSKINLCIQQVFSPELCAL